LRKRRSGATSRREGRAEPTTCQLGGTQPTAVPIAVPPLDTWTWPRPPTVKPVLITPGPTKMVIGRFLPADGTCDGIGRRWHAFDDGRRAGSALAEDRRARWRHAFVLTAQHGHPLVGTGGSKQCPHRTTHDGALIKSYHLWLLRRNGAAMSHNHDGT
jgi:hypothetical protein